jgi:hypothetical protein
MWWNATEVDDYHALFLYPEGQGQIDLFPTSRCLMVVLLEQEEPL